MLLLFQQNLETEDDVTAPSYTTSPFLNGVTATTAIIRATATDASPPITVYGVRLTDGATAPSAAQVKAGTDSANIAVPSVSDTVGSGQPAQLSFAGLVAETSYDMYIAAEDSLGNITGVTLVNVTTTAAPSGTGGLVRPVVISGRMVRPVIGSVVQ